MSVDVSTVPPWKQMLLEKKRRQDEEDQKKKIGEEDRLSKMPSWKRDIILKKQQQKNSLVFIGKGDLSPRGESTSESGSRSPRINEPCNLDDSDDMIKGALNHSFTNDEESEGKASEEHLPPMDENPWLRSEKHRKRSRSPRSNQNRKDINYSDHTVSQNETDGHQIDGVIISNDQSDDVFTEEEVSYGRGFVHKLRQKFAHLSTREDRPSSNTSHNLNLSPKHSRSAENLLDEVSNSTKSLPRSISTSDDVDHFVKSSIFSPPKAKSLENLSSRTASHSNHDNHQASNSTSEISNVSNSSSMGNDLSNHIPENDLESVASISYKHDKDEEYIFISQKAPGSREVYTEELPRANIVSATRSLFEGSVPLSEGTGKRKLSRESLPSENNLDYENRYTETHGIQKDAHESHLQSSTHKIIPNNNDIHVSKLSNHASDVSYSHDTLQNVRSTGKVWYSTEPDSSVTGSAALNIGQSHVDKNDYNADIKHVTEENGFPAVTGENYRANSTAAKHYSHGQSSVSNQPDFKPSSSIIIQKNQRNTDLSLTYDKNDKIAWTESNKILSKKRQAPAPPPVNALDNQKSTTLIDSNDTGADLSKDDSSFFAKSDRTKLHLDFSGSQSANNANNIGPEGQGHDETYDTKQDSAAASSPSYKDLYFSSSKKDTKPVPSSSNRLDLLGTRESVVDDDDEHLLNKKNNLVISANGVLLTESTDSGIGSDSTEANLHDSGANHNLVSVPRPSTQNSSLSKSHVSEHSENKRPTPPSSLPDQKKAAPVNLKGESRKAIPPSSINISDSNKSKAVTDTKGENAKKKKVPTATLR